MNESQPAPEPQTPAASQTPDESQAQPARQKLWRRRGVMVAAGLVVAALMGGAVWALLEQPAPGKKLALPTVTATPDAPVTASPLSRPIPIAGNLSAETRAAQLERLMNPKTSETWLSAPVKLPAQGFFGKDSEADASYFEVGKRGGSTIIMADVVQVGHSISLFERASSGKVTYLSRPDAFARDEDLNGASMLASSVTVDANTFYDSLSIPREIVLDQNYFVSASEYRDYGSPIDAKADAEAGLKFQTLKTLGPSKLVLGQAANASTKLTSLMYFLETPIKTRITLGFLPVEKELRLYTFSSGKLTDPAADLVPITRGCGNLASAATSSQEITDADVVQVGTSPTGRKVYEVKSLSHPLFVKAYDEFKPDAQSVAAYKNYTAKDYQAAHGLLFYKDAYGRWLAYGNSSLRFAGGCAKPVIYLYPKSFEPVNVKVGAQVKVSEPAYPEGRGWQAWASPTGTVWVDGQAYGSLFWEGTGYGQYPNITAGTVVARAQAPATMRRQLYEQGLRGREIEEFLEYWTPKLPATPYVRLTWLSTNQLNELAPLTITPRPDTVIRVFLDFEGLAAPELLPAQHLSAPERRGFTVVEWGGLANFPLK